MWQPRKTPLTPPSQAQPLAAPVAYLLDLIFPPRCVHCGRVDTYWCRPCQQAFQALPVANTAPSTLPPLVNVTTTGAHHGQLQHLVQALKYERATWLADALATRMAQQASQQGWPVDAIVPVPLHLSREHKRGYNQAKLLAQHIAEQLGLPVYDGALYRETFTRSQVGLGRQQRQQNVAGAFRADPSVVRGQQVLLIDDVLTTGATLQACALALVAGGTDAVYGLTASGAV